MEKILNFSNFLQLKNNDLSYYKTYCFSDFSKMYETHHRLDGEQSLEKISNDIAEFIRYQFKHPSGRKKKLYDAKKYIYYYRWDYDEIVDWFKKNEKIFHYPLFLIENKSTISIKISIGRIVKSRRKQKNEMEILNTKGKERASHLTSKNDDNTKNHIIYLNTYLLSKNKGMDVKQFIETNDFLNELNGTIWHEFMHAFDTYAINKNLRSKIDMMKKTYKKYRKDFKIGKEYVTFKKYCDWDGNKCIINKEVISNPDEIRTFYYMLLYYLTETEMHAYLQTFVNQMIIANSENGYDSDIYRRYAFIRKMIEHEFDYDFLEKVFNKRMREDFSKAIPELTNVMKNDDISIIYQKFQKKLLNIIVGYRHKMNKILYDIISIK